MSVSAHDFEIDGIKVKTKVFDANSQPPIVGGVIEGDSEEEIVKKGIIISVSEDNLEYDSSEELSNPHYQFYDDNQYYFQKVKDYRIIDCTEIGKEQFYCTLNLLRGQTQYFFRAFAIDKDGLILYGETYEIHSQSFNRYDGLVDYANVWHAFSNTLFDLVTDEIINPNKGFYYSTNENPTIVEHQVGSGYNTCYKFSTEWNYKLWYYHNHVHSDETKGVSMPIMTYANNKLRIDKNTLDADKDITIYYSINGNYFRPETYTDIYTAPIEITEPCTVCCYAISSDGYISYTNLYVIEDLFIGNESDSDVEFGKTPEIIDLGLSSGTLWASWNLGASSPEEYGAYFAWGETSPKDKYTWSTYKFGNENNFTKYNSIDGLTELDLEDDAANVILGDNWRMPTNEEQLELINECSWEPEVINGISGYRVVGPNGKSIFMPMGGLYDYENSGCDGTTISYINSGGWYWSSTLGAIGSIYSDGLMLWDIITTNISNHERSDGHNIRPVYVRKQTTVGMSELLIDWWNTNYPNGIEHLENNVGVLVGQYKEGSLDAIKEAYRLYMSYMDSGVGNAEEILEISIAAKEAIKVNEILGCYYYIVNYQDYALYENKSEILSTYDFDIPVDETTGETTVTSETAKYIWHLIPVADKEHTFIIQNYGTAMYVESQPIHAHDIKTGIIGDEFIVEFGTEGTGLLYIYHVDEDGNEVCAWNLNGSNTNGGLINWVNHRDDVNNYWYLYPVKVTEEYNTQHTRNQRLQALYDVAKHSYNTGFVYEPSVECTKDDNFTSHGLLTEANLTIVDAIGNSAIHTTDGTGSVSGLLDNNASTYTHTYWENTNYPHYFEIDLGEGNELDAVALKLMRRTGCSEYNSCFGFGEPIIYGRNSLNEEWERCTNLVMSYDINLYAHEEDGSIAVDENGNSVLESWEGYFEDGSLYSDNGENCVGVGVASLGAKYRYLRVQHYKTIIGEYAAISNTYFAASELALFPATISNEKSLNNAVRKDIKELLLNELAKAKCELDAEMATEAQIVALRDAYSDYLEYIEMLKKSNVVCLTDNKSYSQEEDVDVDVVTLIRNFSNTNWQAWYAPFDMPYDDIIDEFTVASLNDVHQFDDDDDGEFDRWTLEILKLKSGAIIHANMPYMIRAKNVGEYSFPVENTTLYSAEENKFTCSSLNASYTFSGNYGMLSGANLATDNSYVMSNGRLLTPNNSTTLKPFRWFLKLENHDIYGPVFAPKQILVYEKCDWDETTGIVLPILTDGTFDVYDLKGRLVKSAAKSIDGLPKGVYIVNGKKVLK